MGILSKAAKEAAKARKARKEGELVEKKGSIATKTTVTQTAIKEAKTANAMDAMQRRIDDLPEGNRKEAFQNMLDRQRAEFEAKQAADVDRVQRKQQQSARDKKMKGNVTLPPMPFKAGGMPKKYNKGGYANCGASMKATQKSTKMAYGGMARKK